MSVNSAKCGVTTPAILSAKRPHSSQQRPLSSAKKPLIFPVDPSKPRVTRPLINARIRNLFQDPNLISMPCISARLFACFTLINEPRDLMTTPGGRPTRSGQQSAERQPLLSLLRALVHVERTSLGHIPQKRKVHFSGFDCSSTRPPVDSILGSQHHWESSILALEIAVDELHKLFSDSENRPTETTVASLEALLAFLYDMEIDSGALMRQECSRSMPDYWPSDRFITAAATYREDFEDIKAHLEGSPGARISDLPLMTLERQLADMLGQAIRFYLRLFFNPEPLRVTSTPPDELPGATANLTKRRSRVSEMVIMTLPDGIASADSAIADGSISSVFSKALQCLYSHVGPDIFLSSSFDAPSLIPDAFCASIASKRGLPTKSSPEPISEGDISDIVGDILHCFRFLEISQACRFLCDLMDCRGVKEEIAVVGGWSMVQGYAKKMQRHNLVHDRSADAHLALLGDVSTFFSRLEQCRHAMEGPTKQCTARLLDLSSRFKCGTNKKAKIRAVHPAINSLSDLLNEGPQFMFPQVFVRSETRQE